MTTRHRKIALLVVAGAVLVVYLLIACARRIPGAREANTGRDANSEGPSSDAISAIPAGIFALTAAREPIPGFVLDNRNVVGVVVRGDWPEVETAPGQYDFSYFDTEMARAASAGKAVNLVVTMGGSRGTPTWLWAKGAQKVAFTDEVPFHASAGRKIDVPVFWDPVLLEHKKQLIAALGAHFSGRAELKLVSAQCANATTDDWHVPASEEATSEWRRIEFADDKLLSACKDILDASMAAFPHQIVHMAIGRVPAPLSAEPDGVVKHLIQYAAERYPGRFIVQRHNLAAMTPVPGENRPLFGWDLIRDHSPYSAAQFLWPATDVESCRLDRGTKPCDALDMFRRSVDAGLAYGLRYVEVYAADLRNQSLQPEIERLARGLARSTPVAARSDDGPSSARATGRDAQGDRMRLGSGSGLGKRESFDGPITKRAVEFSIVVPDDYETSTARYPVIYWLHGKGGDDQRATHVAEYLKTAVAARQMPPSIIVFPNGGRDSFYTDKPDGSWPVETMIVEELIPYVDAHYRSVAARDGRFLMGFSMGGFGVLKFAAKYPERFAAVVGYAAPRLDASLGMGGQDAEIFQSVFSGDARRFEENTPSFLFRQNRDRIVKLGLRVRLVAGSDDGTQHSVQKLDSVLTELGIVHEYQMLTGVRHVVGQYYEQDQGAGFAFLSKNLKP